MSVIPLEMVHGKHLAKSPSQSAWTTDVTYVSLDELLKRLDYQATAVELTQVMGRPVYVLRGSEETRYVDASSGEALPTLNQSQIEAVATTYYLHQEPIKTAILLDEPPQEASRVKGASWQIIFDDWLDTTLYLHPITGSLEHVRSDLWRLFDFVWMLHIMDYDEREDFNNPVLISFAIAALLFTLTGIVLLFKSFAPKAKSKRQKRSI